MLKSLLLMAGLLFAGRTLAQNDAVPPPPPMPDVDDTELVVVEQMPEFPGGQGALAAFMVKEVKYPKKAKRDGIEGKVYVSFVVDTAGNITDVSILRGAHPLLDEEAMRAVRLMPKWTPGKQNGKPVKTRFSLPVVFKLT